MTIATCQVRPEFRLTEAVNMLAEIVSKMGAKRIGIAAVLRAEVRLPQPSIVYCNLHPLLCRILALFQLESNESCLSRFHQELVLINST